MASPLSFFMFFVLVVLTSSVSGRSVRTHMLGARNRLNPTKVNARSLEEYEVYNYTQTLDHFNYKIESYMTFQQRYLLIRKYWGGPTNNSPIFLFLCDANDIISNVEYLGFVGTLAQRFNALLVLIEHRYYGTSMPFGSKEEAHKNSDTLGFLSSEQALADYAHVIIDVKKNMSAENCPVIAIGAWYGGVLATWLRLKYPHIAYGAYASSAPILDFLGLSPENGYYAVVSKDFNSTSPSCHNTIRESWFEIDRVAAQPGGLLNLSQMFNTCMPLNTSKYLKHKLEAQYDIIAQYHNVAYMQLFCNAVDGSGVKAYILDKIIAGLVAIRGHQCIHIVDHSFDKYDTWFWQLCTEMVFPRGRGENDTMFQADPFDLEEYTKECQQVFNVTPRPYWIPIEFGGYGIKVVLEKFASNIIFSNGLRDPLSSGGVLQNISDTIVAVYTEEGHHSLDLDKPSDSDPDWLVAQRDTTINIIQEWLSNYIVPNSLKS